MTTTLSTIGYEGASLEDFLATLELAGIAQVLDIRDFPGSRRPGFSKNVLANALAEKGISYLHLKPLGDPKPGREAAREGRYEAFREIYETHLALPAGQTALQTAMEAAQAKPTALMCYERDYEHCHRTIVATAMSELSSFKIRNLGVRKLPGSAGIGRTHVKGSAGTVAIA
jgi:uncharacterized protein (DUF488 family)